MAFPSFAAGAAAAKSAVGAAFTSVSNSVKNFGIRREALSVKTKVIWQGKAREDEIKKEAVSRMVRVVDRLKKRVVQNLTRKTVTYTSTSSGGVIANRSKPGEYPYRDTGLLASSIRGRVVITTKSVKGTVYTDVPYGKILEKKLKRPFLQKTFDEARPELEAIIKAPLTGKVKAPRKHFIK